MNSYGAKFRNIDKYTNRNVENAYYVNNITLSYNKNHANRTRLNKEEVLKNRARTRNRRARGIPELKRSNAKRNLLQTRKNNKSKVRNVVPKIGGSAKFYNTQN